MNLLGRPHLFQPDEIGNEFALICGHRVLRLCEQLAQPADRPLGMVPGARPVPLKNLPGLS